jgi:hypothetical protein
MPHHARAAALCRTICNARSVAGPSRFLGRHSRNRHRSSCAAIEGVEFRFIPVATPVDPRRRRKSQLGVRSPPINCLVGDGIANANEPCRQLSRRPGRRVAPEGLGVQIFHAWSPSCPTEVAGQRWTWSRSRKTANPKAYGKIGSQKLAEKLGGVTLLLRARLADSLLIDADRLLDGLPVPRKALLLSEPRDCHIVCDILVVGSAIVAMPHWLSRLSSPRLSETAARTGQVSKLLVRLADLHP